MLMACETLKLVCSFQYSVGSFIWTIMLGGGRRLGGPIWDFVANKMKWAIWNGCITRAMFCKFISFFIAKNVGTCMNLVGKHSMGSVLYVGVDYCNEELIQVVGLRRGVLDVVV